jgi:hypothetical protein
MQRYRDEWVFDKTMFDYTTQSGGCSCCNLQHVDRSLIGQCSDMDTAEAVAQDEENPWPEEIKYAVWADRVSLRKQLKADRARYAQFWGDHAPAFVEWVARLPLADKKELCIIPVDEFKQCVTYTDTSKRAHLHLSIR